MLEIPEAHKGIYRNSRCVLREGSEKESLQS